MGSSSVRVSMFAVQPGTGFTDTLAIGASSGMLTSTLVVFVSSVSFGTRNEIFVKLPFGASSGFTDTWA